MKIKNILVTGSSGFVGTGLVKALLEQQEDYQIVGVDRVDPEKTDGNSFSFQYFDLAEETWLKELTFKADIIIHCAAAKGDFGISPDEYERDNVAVTAKVITYAEKVGCPKIIYYSTVSAHGHKQETCYEDDGFTPDGAYGSTKYEGELLLQRWLEENDERQLVVLRPSVIYGVNNYANMYNLLYTLDRRFPVSIGKGKHIKSMISVNNMVHLNLYVLANLDKLPEYSAYICVDQPYLTLNEIMKIMSEVEGIKMPKLKIPVFLAYLLAIPFELISRITGKDLKVTFERIHKLNTSTDYRSKLLEKTGYVQKFSTRDEILKMTRWYKTVTR